MPSRPRTAIVALLLALGGLLLTTGCSDSDSSPPATPQASVVVIDEALAPVDSGFADANGARLYYEVYGEGEPLLLIMGLGANHLGWALHVPVYAEEFQVIVFDNRGVGQSSFPEDTEFTIPLLADDAAALLDALGIDIAHVYGVSLGGMIAQDLALRHPEMVRSLILGATTPGGANAVPAEPEALSALLDLGDADNGAAGAGLLEVLFSPEYLTDHGSEWLERFQSAADYPATPSETYTAQLLAGAGHDTYDRLPDIAAPTLVIHGTDDPLFPVDNGRTLAERIPGAELFLLEGARHGYLMERQADADAAVLEFLRAHSGEGTGE